MKTPILALVKGQQSLPKLFECQLALEQQAAQQALEEATQARDARREQAALDARRDQRLAEHLARREAERLVRREAELREFNARCEAEKLAAEKRAQAQVVKEKAEAEIAKRRNEHRQLKADLEARAKTEKEKTIAAAKEARREAEEDRRQRQRQQHQRREQTAFNRRLNAVLGDLFAQAPIALPLPLDAPARQVMALGVNLRDNNIDRAIKLCNAAPSAAPSAAPKANPWTRRVKARVEAHKESVQFAAEHREKALAFQDYLNAKGFERDVRIAADAQLKGGFGLTFIERQNLAKGKVSEARMSVVGRIREKLADLPVREVDSLEEAFDLLASKPWGVALLGKFAIFHTTKNRIKDDRFQKVVAMMSQEGYTAVTCRMNEWQKLGVRTLSSSSVVYLSKEGVSLLPVNGATALGEAVKWCSSVPAVPAFSVPGDIFMSPELVHYMQQVGRSESPYEVIAGQVLVDDGYGLQTKQFAVFHGSREYGKLDGQPWFEAAIENVDLVFCCHWAITLPTHLVHKAVPMWYSRVTGLSKGDVLRIRAMGLPHTLQAHHEQVEQNIFRLAWGQWWQNQVVFGTEHYDATGRKAAYYGLDPLTLFAGLAGLWAVKQAVKALKAKVLKRTLEAKVRPGTQSNALKLEINKLGAPIFYGMFSQGFAMADVDILGPEHGENSATATSHDEAVDACRRCLAVFQQHIVVTGYRIWKTKGGARLLIDTPKTSFEFDLMTGLLSAGADPLYLKLTHVQQSYNVRMSPKWTGEAVREEQYVFVDGAGEAPLSDKVMETAISFNTTSWDQAAASVFANWPVFFKSLNKNVHDLGSLLESRDGMFLFEKNGSLSLVGHALDTRVPEVLAFLNTRIAQIFTCNPGKMRGVSMPVIDGEVKWFNPLYRCVAICATKPAWGGEWTRLGNSTVEELVRDVEAAKASPEYQGAELMVQYMATLTSYEGWIYTSETGQELGLPAIWHLGAEDPEETVQLLKKHMNTPRTILPPGWIETAPGFEYAHYCAFRCLELVEDGFWATECLTEYLADLLLKPYLEKLYRDGATAENVHKMMPELPAVIEVPTGLDRFAVGKATREVNRLVNELVDTEGGTLEAIELEFAVEKNRTIIRLYTGQFVGRTLIKEGSTKLGWLYDLLYTGTPNHKLRNEFQEKLSALLKGLASREVTRWERVDDVLSTYLPENGTSYTQANGASCQDFATTPIHCGFVYGWDTGFGAFYSKHRSNPHIYNWLSFFNIVKAYVLRSKGQIVARTLIIQTERGIALGSMYGDRGMVHLHTQLSEHLDKTTKFLFDNAQMPYVASMGSLPYNDVDIRFQKTEQPGVDAFVRFTYKGFNPMKKILVGHKEEILAMSAEDRANFEFVLCCDRAEVARVTGLKPYGDVQKYPRAFRNDKGVVFLADAQAEQFVVLCEGVDFSIPFKPENLEELGTKEYYGGYLCVDDSTPSPTSNQGELGDFVVTPEFAVLDLALGNRESTYTVLAGNCAVKTVDGWVLKKLVSFHGSAQIPSDPFFHKLVARAEIVLCCHWANMLPIEQQHKAVPLIWSSITGQGGNVLSQTASHPHTMAAGWEEKDGLSTMAWSLIWKNVRKVDYLGYDYFQDIAVLSNRQGLENLPVGVTTRGSDSPDGSKTDGLSLSSPETGRNVGGSMEKKSVGEGLVRACQLACRRKADGTVSMKFKNSAFTAVWNELLGIVANQAAPSNNRPVVPGHGDCPAENIQGLPVYMAAYEGTDGWRVGMPAFKVEEGAYGPATLYTRAGYAWNGLSNFGIYGGSPADEHARHPSTMRVQFPQNITTAEGVRLVFVDFSNKNTPDKLVELGVLAAPQGLDRKHLLQLIKADMLGVVAGGKEPGIDGTIWVATTGVPFAPKMPKGMSTAVYQFRGSCVFPESVTQELLAQGDEYRSLAVEVVAEIERTGVHNLRPIVLAEESAQEFPRLVQWTEIFGRDVRTMNEYLAVLGEEPLTVGAWAQLITYDLMIGKNVETHQRYFSTSGHYGAYLKGAAATRSYLAHGVVLIDINAVKDISKKLVKEALKANQGAFEAPAGQKYVIGMMQDYSRGGIRVGAQPNTYIRSHYEGEFVMAEHIDRYISFLADQTLAQLQAGIGVGELLENLRKALGFTNAGEMDLEEVLVEVGNQVRGFAPAFWNNPSGRKQIENLFKTIANRYTFGFETKAMERIGTFVSVKGYLSDCNVLPAAFPNGKMTSNSVLVEFEGKTFDTSLPIPVILFKNDQFWTAMKRDVTLAGVLRYPVSNKDMFSGYLVLSPEALIRDAQLRELAGFGQWDVETLKWFFAGLSQGIYANSLTVKELLCGDTDGDTAGIVPVDADWTLSGRTITVSLNNGDAKFFWAITETRDLTKRRFAELEGFVHLQGRRRLNAACVDKVLGESGLATGSCALMQQIVTAILTTHDKGRFVLVPGQRRSVRLRVGKDTLDVAVSDSAEAQALWAWFVSRYLEAAYVLLPVSLELAIMSQKKDLIQAFHTVTGLWANGAAELVYGENGERRAQLYSPTLQRPILSQSVDQLFGHYMDRMVGHIGWASQLGSLIRAIIRLTGARVQIEGHELPQEIQFVSATRTTTIAESIPANLLLANRTDEAWGILEGDNLAWTNHYWAEYVANGYRRIRDTVQAMTSNASTYGADVELRTNWNRGYDRGSFAALNVNTAREGVHVSDKGAFFSQVARWIEIKAQSRIFGMNLHGWTHLPEAFVRTSEDGLEEVRDLWSRLTLEARQATAMLYWAWLHSYSEHRGQGRVDEWISSFKRDLGRQWWIKTTFDQLFQTQEEIVASGIGQKDTAWMKRTLEHAGIEVLPGDQVRDAFYLAVIHGKIGYNDAAYGVYQLSQFLGFSLEYVTDDRAADLQVLIRNMPSFIGQTVDGRMGIGQDAYATFSRVWKDLVEKTQLASKFRASVKAELAELTKEWTEDTYASLYALANQEVGFGYGQTTRWTREMTVAGAISNLNRARQYNEPTSTEYVREVFSKADAPTTFGYFRRPNLFLLEVVSEEMESHRIAFEESWFRYSFVAAEGVAEVPKKVAVRPWFRDGVHAIEVFSGDMVLGWIPCDPTSRVLLYFKDEELEVVGFLKNRNPNKVQAGFITNLVKDGNDGFYLAEAPAVAADQKIMLDRFMTVNADQVQGCTFGIIIVKAEMKSEALMIQRYIKAVEKAVEKALKGKKDVSAALSAKKADKRMIAVAGDAALDLQNALIGKVLGNDNWTSEKVDGKIQKTWTVQFGEATINSFNGVIEVDRPEVELAEEMEVTAAVITTDEAYLNSLVDEAPSFEEEEVDYPMFEEGEEEFPADDVNPSDVSAQQTEEIIEVAVAQEQASDFPAADFEVQEELVSENDYNFNEDQDFNEEASEEVVEVVEVVEEVVEEQPAPANVQDILNLVAATTARMSKDTTPVRGSAPVAPVVQDAPAVSGDSAILAQIAALVGQLNPATQQVFNAGVNAAKAKLVEEKAKLEQRQAELQAQLAEVQKQLQDVETALNDDGDGDDDGGGNGGGTPAPADNGPATPPPAPAAPAAPVPAAPVQSSASLRQRIVVVTGGRDFSDKGYIETKLNEVKGTVEIAELIHGDARGVDRICGDWANANHIPVRVMPADWSQGKSAGFRRNEEMARLAEVCVAFPGGNGTAHMKKTCQDLGLEMFDFQNYTAPPVPQQAEAITEFRGESNFLSNFSFVQIEFKGKKFKSVEHFYQAMKFKGHPELQEQIRDTVSAGDAKKIANQNKDKIRADWDDVKLDVMKWALEQKFSKPSLKTALLRTGDAVISHVNTWGDTFWGVCRGVGEDHLGKMLMEVRDELK